MSDEDLLVAAVVGAARGLRGEVSVDVRTDLFEERFYPGADFETDSEKFPVLTVEKVNSHRGRFFLTFAEITTREEAESLRGTGILVEEFAEEDAWYEKDLIGLTVRTSEGATLGIISGLQPGAAQDLLLVDTGGDQTVMVPFVEEIVPTVNVEEGYIEVTPPAGLFTDEDA